MRYIDSSADSEDQTVAHWMANAISMGIKEFRCQAGYFTLEGASVLLPTLEKSLRAGAKISMLVGSNGGATLASHVSYLAGALHIPAANVRLGIVRFLDSLFHPKVYVITRPDGSQTAYVGSANMTGPGLSGKNIEAGVIFDTSLGDENGLIQDICARIDHWFDGNIAGISNIESPTDIENLLKVGALALTQVQSKRDVGEEGGMASEKFTIGAPRRNWLFKIPALNQKVENQESQSPHYLTGQEISLLVTRTEASYHYPQGVHLGHILSILYYFSRDRVDSPFDDYYIRLKGNLGDGRIAGLRRQIKYKLQAAIELGLISDIRVSNDIDKYEPLLTERGSAFWEIVKPFLNENDLQFSENSDGGFSSTRMPLSAGEYNEIILNAARNSSLVRTVWGEIALSMPAADQMLKYLKSVGSEEIFKEMIYSQFFHSESVIQFCDDLGIEPATEESARHRCPFLLNLLESAGVLIQRPSSVRLT